MSALWPLHALRSEVIRATGIVLGQGTVQVVENSRCSLSRVAMMTAFVSFVLWMLQTNYATATTVQYPQMLPTCSPLGSCPAVSTYCYVCTVHSITRPRIFLNWGADLFMVSRCRLTALPPRTGTNMDPVQEDTATSHANTREALFLPLSHLVRVQQHPLRHPRDQMERTIRPLNASSRCEFEDVLSSKVAGSLLVGRRARVGRHP